MKHSYNNRKHLSIEFYLQDTVLCINRYFLLILYLQNSYNIDEKTETLNKLSKVSMGYESQ